MSERLIVHKMLAKNLLILYLVCLKSFPMVTGIPTSGMGRYEKRLAESMGTDSEFSDPDEKSSEFEEKLRDEEAEESDKDESKKPSGSNSKPMPPTGGGSGGGRPVQVLTGCRPVVINVGTRPEGPSPQVVKLEKKQVLMCG